MPEIIRIGSLREPVELLDAPRGGRQPRIGRIRHANGENVQIDLETLEKLMARAEASDPSKGTVSTACHTKLGWLMA